MADIIFDQKGSKYQELLTKKKCVLSYKPTEV